MVGYCSYWTLLDAYGVSQIWEEDASFQMGSCGVLIWGWELDCSLDPKTRCG